LFYAEFWQSNPFAPANDDGVTQLLIPQFS